MRTAIVGVAVVGLAIAACPRAERPVPAGPASEAVVDDVTFRVESTADAGFPPAVEATLTVENESERARSVTFPDGCIVLLRAHREPDRSGLPAWDQGQVVFCTMALVTLELEPGETETYSARANVFEILGDSLPEGTYHFSVLVRPEGRSLVLPAGSVELFRRPR